MMIIMMITKNTHNEYDGAALVDGMSAEDA